MIHSFSRPMDEKPFVSILRPPAVVSKWSDAAPLTPPLGPAYIASSLIAAGYRAQIVDAIGEAPKKVTLIFDGSAFAIGLTESDLVERIDPDANIIGVSCTFSHDWPLVRNVLNLVRQRFPKLPIVAGGEHITAMWDFCLKDCPALDICVLGEGEETMTEVARALERGEGIEKVSGIAYRNAEGQVITTGRRGRIRNIDQIPAPNWDLVPLHNYLEMGLSFGVNLGRTVPLLATRGCPYQCTFCSSPAMWTTKWSARAPSCVLDEIEGYMKKYQATNFDFYDLTMIIRRDWILDFARMIKERGLKFTWQLPSGTRSEALDYEVCEALYSTGCRNISYAPESGSPEELKRIKKKVNLVKMLESMRSAVRVGLNIKCNIIIGFPDQLRSDVMKTLLLLVKMAWVGVHDVSLSMFSAYPGSELFDQLVERKVIPRLDNRFFVSLTTYKDISSSVNWCNTLSPRELGWYRLGGYLLFYGLNYGLRPWRLLKTVKNVVARKEESRLDKSLISFFDRQKGKGNEDLKKAA